MRSMFDQLSAICGVRALRLLTALYVLTALFEGLTLALMIPVLEILITDSGKLANSSGHWLIAVALCGSVTLVLGVVANVFSYRNSVYTICDTLIAKMGEHTLKLPLGWFSASREAKLISAVSREVNTVSHLSSIVLPALIDATVLPAILTLALAWLNPLAGLLVCLGGIGLVLLGKAMWRESEISNSKESGAASLAAGRLVEFAKLQPLLRATGAIRRGWKPLNIELEREHIATREVLFSGSRAMRAFTLLVQVIFAAVVAVTFAQLIGLLPFGSLNGQASLTVVVFITVTAICARLAKPISVAVIYLKEANNFQVALDVVSDILSSPALAEPNDSEKQMPNDFSVVFDRVNFGYQDDRKVINDICFTAPMNRVTAIVGPSGVGKSTILRLIARFFEPQTGQVCLGGVPVNRISTADLMSHISMVFQDVYLFNTTIRENLRIARPEATEEQILDAARFSGLEAMISELPDGWDTQVGKGGLSLSGGQRQRISIARAFLKNSPVLLLDEITSALDSENEAVITRAVKQLSSNRTVIVVAHRLSTIMDADQVVVLGHAQPNGSSDAISSPASIVQLGNPRELAKVPGLFRDYCELLSLQDSHL